MTGTTTFGIRILHPRYVSRWCCWLLITVLPIQWRHNERGSTPNHQRLHCLINCRFRRRSKKTSQLCFSGLCAGNSLVTGELPAQKARIAENVSIWWRHHVHCKTCWSLLHIALNWLNYSSRGGGIKHILHSDQWFWLIILIAVFVRADFRISFLVTISR